MDLARAKLSGLKRLPLDILVPALLLGACVALRVADPEPVARLRLSVFDAYLRAAPRSADPSFPVKIVAIDEASLAKVGQWPWPRSKLADMVTRLTAAGAKSISIDLVLAEPDRLSPKALLQALGGAASATLEGEVAKLPSNDELLAHALSGAPAVLGIVGETRSSASVAPPRASFSFAGDDPLLFVPSYAGGVSSLPMLTDAAQGIGAVNWLPSGDQVVRRVPLLVSIAGKLYPSLTLDGFRVGENQSTVFVKSSSGSGVAAFGQKTGIESIRVGGTVMPADGRGELWLKFAPSDPRRYISAAAVLDPAFDPASVKGRHIIIGATAAGLLDLRATPLDPSVPGVEVHAQALEQILSGEHLVRPAYASGAEILFLLFAGTLTAWLIGRSGALAAAIAGLLAIAAVLLFSWLAYRDAGLLFDPVYPALSIAILYLGSSLTSYVRSEIQRAQIRSAFGHYVAPQLVEELAKNYDKLKLGGETREVTLLFADVRGFSKIAEGLEAEELIRFVNRLFTPLADTILQARGTIDKFMGDAVMAFWNAPVADSDHAKNACHAALAMQEELSRLNGELAAEAAARGDVFAPVRMGIGLNTGPCVVGNVGSPQRFDYSVLGDVVNVAARFEEATKTFGVDIIVGERTAAAASGFALLELGAVTPRGRGRAETIFALVGGEGLAQSEAFAKLRDAHSRLLLAERSGDAAAIRRAIEACRAHSVTGTGGYYEAKADTASA